MTQGIKKNIVTGALAFAFLGLALAACDGNGGETTGAGGSGGAGGGTGGSGADASRAEQYVTATCGKLFECCNASDLVKRTGGTSFDDYAGCRIAYRTIWDAAFEALVEDGEANGRLGFDQAAFDACISAIEGQSCADFAANTSPSCDAIFVPKVDKGGACSVDAECKTKKCEVPAGAAEGTCVDAPPPVAEGQACADDDECVAGLYCDNATDKCAAKKSEGDACTSNEQCPSTCVGYQNGGMGMCAKVCEGGGPGPGPVDEALENAGGPLALFECNRIFDCCTTDEKSELLFSGLDTKNECRTFYAIFAALGLIEIHNDVAQGRVAVDPAKLAACVDQYDDVTCAEYSKGAKFDCADAIKGLVAEGQPCTEDRQCVSNYCYLPGAQDMGTCAAIPAPGAACTGACGEGYYCEAGTCTAKKKAGEPCTASGECGEGRCVPDASNMHTCTLICDGL